MSFSAAVRRRLRGSMGWIWRSLTPAPQVPMGSYQPGTPDVSGARDVEWAANHEVLLPLDDRVFPASILPQIAAGKFERGIVESQGP